MLGLVYLFFSGRPAQDGLNFGNDIHRNIAGLGNMGLLGQILAKEHFAFIDCFVVILIYRADNQLRTVDLVEFSPGFPGAVFQQLQRPVIIFEGTQ